MWQSQVYKNRIPDFVSVLRKQNSREPSSSKSLTTQYQHHLPCGSCVYVKWIDGQYFEAPQVNIEDDAAEKFLDIVLATVTISRQHLANKIPMKRLTQEQWREYNNATNCLICAKPFKSADKTWITASIQRKWKFHASFTTAKVYCFHVIVIFIIASFWFSFR